MQELTQGCTLQDGRYTIQGVLGRGGFGITYAGEAEATLTGGLGNMGVRAKVAIKEFFMRDRCLRNDDGMGITVTTVDSREQVAKYKQKFIDEARTLAGIHHPNVVNVSDVFEENNTVYYVMQYLPGGSLTQKVKSAPAGRFDEQEALRVVREIGRALNYLHSEKQMCHLDVKPANILLGSNGEAVLIDFGIAKSYDNSGHADTSSVNYSNCYAPLEQYQAMTDFSPQTDIYGLGATFYYMLTGQKPPEASKLNEDGLPPCPSYVRPELWRCIEKAMQPRKKDRPATMGEWLTMLDEKPAAVPVVDEEATVADVPEGATTVVDTDLTPKHEKVDYSTPKAGQSSGLQHPKMTERQDGPARPTPEPRQDGRSKMPLVAVIVAVVVVIAGVAAWLLMSGDKDTDNNRSATEVVSVPTAQAFVKLGSADITLTQVQELERHILHDGSDLEEANLKNRLVALKHIFLEGLHPEVRSIKNLQNIYFIHAEEMSPAQQQIMGDFFRLSEAQKARWESGPGQIQSFSELKQQVEDIKNQ